MERLRSTTRGFLAVAGATGVVPSPVRVIRSFGRLRACSEGGDGGCGREGGEQREQGGVAAEGSGQEGAGEGSECVGCMGGCAEEAGESAVAGGAPAVGDGGGPVEGEVAGIDLTLTFLRAMQADAARLRQRATVDLGLPRPRTGQR